MRHLVLLVEEPSMEAFLGTLLPRLLPADRTYEVHAFEGKRDLLSNLPVRLRGYRRWLPSDWRLVVLVDRDDSDCHQLKECLENIAVESGLITRTNAGGDPWQVVNRVVIEELEAWYFGDWEAVREAYPRLPPTVSQKARYRIPMRSAAERGRRLNGSCNSMDTSRQDCARSKRHGPWRHVSTWAAIVRAVLLGFATSSRKRAHDRLESSA